MLPCSKTSIALFAALATSVAEPSSPGGRLEEMRAIYHSQIGVLRVDLLRAHIAKLTALEIQFTKLGMVREAETTRARLSEYKRELAALGATDGGAPAAGSPAARKPISLTAVEAELVGGLKLSRGFIHGWTAHRPVAQWLRRDLAPGRYTVFVDFYPVSGGGGTIEVRNLTQFARVAIPPGGRFGSARQSARVGTFEIGPSIGLRITPVSHGRQELFWLAGVRLVPEKKTPKKP